MITINLTGVWVDVYAATGLKPGTPVRITNRGPFRVFLQVQGTAPVSITPGDVGQPIPDQGSAVVTAGEAKAWLFGHGSVSVIEDWPNLNALDGLWDGRGFRISHRFSALGAGQSIVLRYIAAVDFILKSQTLAVTSGDLQFDAVAGGTEGGSFSGSVFIRGVNITTRRPTPLYTAQNSITTGGTLTGGTITETFDSFSGAGAHATSTIAGAQDFRLLAPGTYYLKLTNVGSGNAAGVYSILWEELP